MEEEHERQLAAEAEVQKRKRAARLRYLLQQSDVFAHFMSKSKDKKLMNVQTASISTTSTSSTTQQPASPSKRHTSSNATPNSATKRRKTEEEEDNALLEQEMGAQSSLSVRLSSQPTLIEGGTMRDYQLEGLNWMIGLNTNGMNGILADEMGLGKTLQSISIFSYIIDFRHINGTPYCSCTEKYFAKLDE